MPIAASEICGSSASDADGAAAGSVADPTACYTAGPGLDPVAAADEELDAAAAAAASSWVGGSEAPAC